MRSGVLMVAIVCSLLVAATARADGITITQRLFDGDGWPRLVANYVPDGSRATASWKVCAPDCGPTVATSASYDAGPTAPGTTFEASATVDGVTTTARSAVWGGQVTNTAPPTFGGEPRAGQTLTPHGGTWAGGWGDDFSLLGMRACRTAAGGDCRAMTASSNQPGHPSQVTVAAAYAGWYVGAIEARFGAGTLFPPMAVWIAPGEVSAVPTPTPGQTVAAGPLVGPVVGVPTTTVRDPATTGLRFTPRVTIRKRAVRRRGALVLATVRCSGRCVARATLRHGRRVVTRRIVVTGGQASVKLLRGTFSRRATKVRVTVRFDRHPATASGSVKLR